MLEFDNDCCHGKTFILLAITSAFVKEQANSVCIYIANVCNVRAIRIV